eukprot:6372901-Alexandrium_andersonii.AAC.1
MGCPSAVRSCRVCAGTSSRRHASKKTDSISALAPTLATTNWLVVRQWTLKATSDEELDALALAGSLQTAG